MLIRFADILSNFAMAVNRKLVPRRHASLAGDVSLGVPQSDDTMPRAPEF